MKLLTIIKRVVDFVLFAMFLFLFSRRFFPKNSHVVIGIICVALIAFHNGLNFPFWWTLRRGKWTFMRRVFLVVNVLLVVEFLLSAFSGLFIVLDIHSRTFPRFIFKRAHACSSMWLFITSAAHFGLHAGAIFSAFKKNKALHNVLITLAALVALAGLYSAFDLGVFEALIAKRMHILIRSRPLWQNLLQLFSVWVFFSLLAHKTQKSVALQCKRKAEKKAEEAGLGA